jgi:hypothetical protein
MKYLVFFFSLVFFLSACNNQVASSHDEHKDTAANTKTEAVHHEEATAVQLNNGEKWKANPETITGVNNMLQIVDSALAGRIAGAPLQDTLKAEFKMIFDKCTMTGTAHDQLHNYLIPLKKKLDDLKEEEDTDETLKEIQAHLKTFGNYFTP